MRILCIIIGSDNIANHFAEIYSKLYNQHQHGTDIAELSQDISKSVGAESLIDADKVTPELVRKALKQMKNGKNDSLLDIQSDCLTSGPDSLTSHLASLFKTFIIHGYVPSFLLTCTLLPLVKDNLADITSSNNYRAIASGSLLLKLLDIIILLLEGDKLGCDKLQFGFQAGTSTSMCSWTATTVIEHYNRNGRSIYACAMDLSKAFDLVEWKSLFLLLMEKKVSPIFVRLLLYVYCNQYCDVKWNSSFSKSFSVSNGVRQGAVSSPLLFSVYIDDLIKLLRKSGLGCRIDNFFYGVLGYADDLLLLSASRTGLQAMVSICEKFAKSRRLKFSTDDNPAKSKTKCVIFHKAKTSSDQVAPIVLNGDPLPWVSNVKHLGNILDHTNSMKVDCLAKRGKFIGKVNSILQEFHHVEPDVMVRLLNIYATSYYGSVLWDLYSPEVKKIYSSWNVTIRKVFKVPYTTHRYLITPLSCTNHPKTLLTCRMIKFMESLRTSSNGGVRYLASLVFDDRRTLVGRSVSKIARECNISRGSLNSRNVKSLKYFEIPTENEWTVPILRELLGARDGQMVIPGIDMQEINMMIEDICTK